jgi:hypothetical protein
MKPYSRPLYFIFSIAINEIVENFMDHIAMGIILINNYFVPKSKVVPILILFVTLKINKTNGHVGGN